MNKSDLIKSYNDYTKEQKKVYKRKTAKELMEEFERLSIPTRKYEKRQKEDAKEDTKEDAKEDAKPKKK